MGWAPSACSASRLWPRASSRDSDSRVSTSPSSSPPCTREAFCIGAHGWVGIYFIASAEAGGARQSGLLSGVSFAAIVVGLLMGAPLFGSVPEASDSYGAA